MAFFAPQRCPRQPPPFSPRPSSTPYPVRSRSDAIRMGTRPNSSRPLSFVRAGNRKMVEREGCRDEEGGARRHPVAARRGRLGSPYRPWCRRVGRSSRGHGRELDSRKLGSQPWWIRRQIHMPPAWTRFALL
jgi:hypothetical protein